MTQKEFLTQMNQDYQDLENILKETPQNYPNPFEWLKESQKRIEQYDFFISSNDPYEFSKTIPIIDFSLESVTNTDIRHLDFLGLFISHFFGSGVHNESKENIENIENKLKNIFKRTY